MIKTKNIIMAVSSSLLDLKLSNLLTGTCSNVITSFQQILDKEREFFFFDIDCTKFNTRFHSNDIRYSEEFKDVFGSLEVLKNPVLYWFEIVSDTSRQEIIDSILKYKSEDGTRATPAIRKNLIDDSNVLYVGKVKTNFPGRLITHFGYLRGKGKTQGLQLGCWAIDICLKLRLNILVFDSSIADYIGVFEYAFAKELKPIVGKHK